MYTIIFKTNDLKNVLTVFQLTSSSTYFYVFLNMDSVMIWSPPNFISYIIIYFSIIHFLFIVLIYYQLR